MPRATLLVALAIVVSGTGGTAAQQPAPAPLAKAGTSDPAAGRPVFFLWPNGAPGSDGKSRDEKVRVTDKGEHVVSSIDKPSLTVYLPPRDKASTASVIVAPGGGHRELWMDHEGHRVAEVLASRGITAFVLKYRLAREEGSTYTVEKHALDDIQRAIRLVRSRKQEWLLDPERVGVMGFSAGGHLAGLAAAAAGTGHASAADPIDRLSAKPSFQALIYPGSIPQIRVSSDTPQTFLLCGGEDGIAGALVNLYTALRQSGVPSELHVYAGVGHGFGQRDSNPKAVAGWLDRFTDWMNDRGLLKCSCE
jgi:endo-1,4-beta-xylanase